MKQGWTYKKLGELAYIKGGKRVPKGYKLESIDTGYKYIRVSDFTDDGTIDTSQIQYISKEVYEQIKNYTITDADVYISIAGTIGKAGIIPSSLNGANLTENACKLVFKVPVEKRYIYSYTKSNNFIKQIEKATKQASQPKLALTRLAEVTIPVPPLPEQQRIVERLDSAFAHIDELKANAEKQVNEARALFQKALSKAMEPKEGWEGIELIKLFNFIDYRGATPTKLSSGIPLVTAKNVKYGYLDYSIKDYISKEEYETRKSRGISHKGDILFTTEAPLGNVAIADLDEFSAGQRLITLQQYPNPCYDIVNRFYYYFMLGPRFQDRIKELATGATAQGIKAKLLKTVVVSLPPLSDQQRIVERLDSLSKNVKALEENQRKVMAECDALKQALLRKVFE